MDHSPWLRVPIGPDAARWRTFTPSRTALIVVRTQTTVSWLFDLLPELLGDPRIQVVFTVNGESSAFEPGVAEAVERLGGTLLPWGQAIDMPFDLAISASFRGGLDHLQAPVLVLPHGPGYTRLTGSPTADWPGSLRPAGGRMAIVALTHPAQRSQWWSQLESDHVSTAVVGDPCFDVLRTSIARVDRYRRALGVRPHQRLVVVSSTWGPGSLIATRPSILEELVAELPMDTYVIAAVLHPNVWVGHGKWQLRTWLRASLDGGVRLIPHLSGWRATIVAADCLIGDHGSVTSTAPASECRQCSDPSPPGNWFPPPHWPSSVGVRRRWVHPAPCADSSRPRDSPVIRPATPTSSGAHFRIPVAPWTVCGPWSTS